jgi:signal transduction histidine kinase
VRSCLATGVSEGLARHLGAPVWAVRSLFVVLVLFAGMGVLLYAWCWAFTPWEAGDQAPTRRAPLAWVLLSASAVALFLEFSALSSPASYDVFGRSDGTGYVLQAPLRLIGAVLLMAVLATAAGVWAALIDRHDPARGPRHALAVRALSVVVLVVAAIVPLRRLEDDGIVILGTALLPVLGVLLVMSSTLIEKWRELSGERIARVREEQRAEMAAHLHDSVLQTLALIQNRAGASSEVARLARAQERELRSWLFDGDTPADSDLPTDLRDYAGGLELDYPVRIDVVSAGASTERASGEVAAAAREAMLNAARHAGGEISVYLEGTPASVDVFVRDRGGGFDPDAVPADRLGVRESIVGRMRRIGGSATIRPGAGGVGTEVHLRFAPQGARLG